MLENVCLFCNVTNEERKSPCLRRPRRLMLQTGNMFATNVDGKIQLWQQSI